MKYLSVLTACLLLFLSSGCSITGSLLINRSEDPHRVEAQKVVSIQPTYFSRSLLNEDPNPILSMEQERATFETLLTKNAERAGIELDIYSPSQLQATDVDYFNDLLPLKQTILLANDLQDVDTRYKRGGAFAPYTRTFRKPITLPVQYSALAEKYGTPYFSLQGLFDLEGRRRSSLRNLSKHEILFYHVVVDVVKSEVIYRELRVMSKKPNESNLGVILYDSFSIFRKD